MSQTTGGYRPLCPGLGAGLEGVYQSDPRSEPSADVCDNGARAA